MKSSKCRAQKPALIFLFILLLFILNKNFEIIAVHFKHENGVFRILSYNIHSTGSNFENDASKIAKMIIENNPTFVYLTEFYESKDDTLHTLLKQDYNCYSTKHRWGQNEGDVFYSKWKIDSIARFYVNEKRIMAYRVQISQVGDTLALYCCHLASNNLNSNTTTLASIKEGYRKRNLEVQEILSHIKT